MKIDETIWQGHQGRSWKSSSIFSYSYSVNHFWDMLAALWNCARNIFDDCSCVNLCRGFKWTDTFLRSVIIQLADIRQGEEERFWIERRNKKKKKNSGEVRLLVQQEKGKKRVSFKQFKRISGLLAWTESAAKILDRKIGQRIYVCKDKWSWRMCTNYSSKRFREGERWKDFAQIESTKKHKSCLNNR